MTLNDDVSLYDLFRPDIAAHPYPFYAQLRARSPVFWDAVLQSWVVSRYSDVQQLLHHPLLSEERIAPFLNRLQPEQRATMAPLADVLSRMMLFTDPPDHTRLRGVVHKAFTPRLVRRLRAYIKEKVAQLLSPLLRRGQLDVIADFAAPLSNDVIAEMLGIPAPDRGRFHDWTSLLHAFFTLSSREVARVVELRAYFDDLLEQRRQDEGDDLVSALLAAQRESNDYTVDDLYATFLLLIDAGQVTTTNLIGNGMLALLKHSDQLALLRRTPSLITSAVAELLRYDSPVQFTSRIVRSDLQLHGQLLPAGANVTLLIGAANHDDTTFADPDRLDITRTDARHLSFGYGIHYCLGAALASIEGEIALLALATQLERPVLQSSRIQRAESINFRFLTAFPLSCAPPQEEYDSGYI